MAEVQALAQAVYLPILSSHLLAKKEITVWFKGKSVSLQAHSLPASSLSFFLLKWL